MIGSRTAAAIAIAAGSFAGHAGATSLTVDFGLLGGASTQGGSATACGSNCVLAGATEKYFTTGGVSIGAAGYNGSDAFAYVTQKPGAFGTNGGETGIGESDTSPSSSNVDYEITSSTYLLIDNTAAIAAGYQSASFAISSMQVGEGAKIFNYTGSLTSLNPAKLSLLSTLSGANGLTQSVAIPDDQYIVIQATSGDVVVSEAVYNTAALAPEPGAILLLATGLIGLAGARRYRRQYSAQ